MTPLVHPHTRQEHSYNEHHLRSRAVVEHTIGVLKARSNPIKLLWDIMGVGKMALACTCRRLPALLRLLFTIALIGFLCQDISGLLVNDHQTLIDLNEPYEVLLNHKFEDKTSRLPPHLASVPPYLLRSPAFTPRKRPRKHGKCGGVLVRVKAY